MMEGVLDDLVKDLQEGHRIIGMRFTFFEVPYVDGLHMTHHCFEPSRTKLSHI